MVCVSRGRLREEGTYGGAAEVMATVEQSRIRWSLIIEKAHQIPRGVN